MKIRLDYYSTPVNQKLQSYDVQLLSYKVGRTDRRMEKVTYRGGCPTLKISKRQISGKIL